MTIASLRNWYFYQALAFLFAPNEMDASIIAKGYLNFILLCNFIKIMAEFSTEWAEINGFFGIADFSILSIFKKLKERKIYRIICEGFGISAIKNWIINALLNLSHLSFYMKIFAD